MNAVPKLPVDCREDFDAAQTAQEREARIAEGLKELEKLEQKRQAYFAGMLDEPEPPIW